MPLALATSDNASIDFHSAITAHLLPSSEAMLTKLGGAALILRSFAIPVTFKVRDVLGFFSWTNPTQQANSTSTGLPYLACLVHAEANCNMQERPIMWRSRKNTFFETGRIRCPLTCCRGPTFVWRFPGLGSGGNSFLARKIPAEKARGLSANRSYS